MEIWRLLIAVPFWVILHRWSWNATPFWQRKVPSSNDIHSVGALVLYDNAIYSVCGILFNCIKPRQNHTAADVCQRPRNPHCTIISSHHTQEQTFIYLSSTNFKWSDTNPQLNSPLYFLMTRLDLLAAKRLPSFFFAPKNLRSVRVCSLISILMSRNN